uniref:Uncharacterized protein n=1 Tax=Pongo abelii TaxID=9601 RepID=A0A8I5TJT3_PONAB
MEIALVPSRPAQTRPGLFSFQACDQGVPRSFAENFGNEARGAPVSGERGRDEGARAPASASGEPGPLASLRGASPSLELRRPRSEVKAPSGPPGLHSRSSPAPSASVEPQAWVRDERDAALARGRPSAPKTREQVSGEKPLEVSWSRESPRSCELCKGIWTLFGGPWRTPAKFFESCHQGAWSFRGS